MENEIKTNINNPKQLEKLYRNHKGAFTIAFNNIYQELTNEPTAQAWNERLNFKDEHITWGNKNEILFIVVAAFVGGLIAKMPSFLGIEYDVYMSKNIGFVVFPILTAYFIWKQQLSMNKLVLPLILFTASAIFTNSSLCAVMLGVKKPEESLCFSVREVLNPKAPASTKLMACAVTNAPRPK